MTKAKKISNIEQGMTNHEIFGKDIKAPLGVWGITRLLIAVFTIGQFAACVSNTKSNNATGTVAGTNNTTEEKTLYPEGKTIYQKTCIACHGTSGEGSMGMYPPLAKSDFLLADKNRAIYQVIKGSSTTYTVNGAQYNGVMPSQQLSDEETSQVLNYVYHAWGNNGFVLTTADVKAVRDSIKK